MSATQTTKWMAGLRFTGCVLVLAFGAGAQAHETIVAFAKEAVHIYASPAGKRTGELKKSAVEFPIAIIERDGDFGRINTGSGSVWIDLRRAKVESAASDECLSRLANGTLAKTDHCDKLPKGYSLPRRVINAAGSAG